MQPELAVQADQLEEKIGQAPPPATARIVFADGTSSLLRYSKKDWKIDLGLALVAQTPTPKAALRALIRAVTERKYQAVMRLLAKPVRSAIDRDLGTRAKLLEAWLKKGNKIEVTGDTVRVRYDPRYKVELVKEGGQWRILDVD